MFKSLLENDEIVDDLLKTPKGAAVVHAMQSAIEAGIDLPLEENLDFIDSQAFYGRLRTSKSIGESLAIIIEYKGTTLNQMEVVSRPLFPKGQSLSRSLIHYIIHPEKSPEVNLTGYTFFRISVVLAETPGQMAEWFREGTIDENIDFDTILDEAEALYEKWVETHPEEKPTFKES